MTRKIFRLIYNGFAKVFWGFKGTPLMIIGDGRSGTTWVQEVVNKDGGLIEYFEPFHKNKLVKSGFYPSGESFVANKSYIQNVLSGVATRKRISVKPKYPLYRGILIKDISCFFILQNILELSKNESKVLVVIRNPISVAKSKMNYGEWCSLEEIQRKVGGFEDCYLNCEMPNELKRKLKDNELFLHVTVWACIYSHLLSISNDQFFFVFYEELKKKPMEGFKSIFDFFQIKGSLQQDFRKLSQTTVKNKDYNLTVDELTVIKQILCHFNLQDLYSFENWEPKTIFFES